jgi:2-polyprenyl-6-hydroxyphenyl methylase/3-demethylubiquinone-9 3-methyltransferase
VTKAITGDYGWASADAPESSGYINPAIVELVRRSGARDVLDAGCGNGALCGDLDRAGFHVVGIDGDRQGIDLARSRFPQVRFEVATFEGSPVELAATTDGRFDCVVSTEVIEHLYAPHELARFCFDALRPGGTLVISTPYHGYLKNLLLSLLNKWDYHHTALWHGGHIKFWSPATLGALLRQAGFEMMGFKGVGRLPYLWKSMLLVARKPDQGKDGGLDRAADDGADASNAGGAARQ